VKSSLKNSRNEQLLSFRHVFVKIFNGVDFFNRYSLVLAWFYSRICYSVCCRCKYYVIVCDMWLHSIL